MLHVSANSVSSSLREQTQLHLRADGLAASIGSEIVEVSTLDERSIDHGSCRRIGSRSIPKALRQRSLEGGTSTLKTDAYCELELSTQEVYSGQTLYLDLLATPSARIPPRHC